MGLRDVPPSDPRSTDPQFAGGLAKINPAGLREEDLQRIRDVTDKGIKDLEDRYKEPNYFKVAAGFAKPQLGGFLASLGSASEAMAENVEQQRENILPITNLKTQRELANTLLGQKINQRDIFDKWLATKRPMDSNTFQSIMRLGTDTDIARSAEKYWTQEQQKLQAVGSAAQLSHSYKSLQGAFDDLIDFSTKPDAKPEEIAAQREALRNQQDGAKPKLVDPAVWAGMTLEQRQVAMAEEAKSQQKAGLDELGKLRVDHDDAGKRLPKMADIRDLALGKGLPSVTIKDANGKDIELDGQQQMDRMLGMFRGSNPTEALIRAVTEKTSLFQGADSYVRQLIQNPASRANFERLAKLLAAQQVQFAGTLVNQTDAAREVANQAQPGTQNSQRALVAILDQMAFGERHAIDNYVFAERSNVPGRQLAANPEWRKKQDEFSTEYRRYARGEPSYNLPWFYKQYSERPKEEGVQQGAQPQTGGATKPPAKTPARLDTQNGLDGKPIRRNPQTGNWDPVN
jgi:hypothetical protein